ncbi:DNA-binding domain-containing protein [Tistrella bauzanensis]|uniref:DNA-binding domain-containing protein n=1 Tax=Tistrella TaxID=171436 RepID=UPI0031F664E1
MTETVAALQHFQDQVASIAWGRRPVDPSALRPWMAPDAPDRLIARRLAVHRRNALGAAVQSLEAAFPVVARMVGLDCFAAVVTRHLRHQPPSTPQLSQWGAGFAADLAADPDLAAWPAVAETARLEWARVAVWFAVGAEHFTPGATIPDHLAAHPAARVIDSPCPILSLWQAHQPGASLTIHQAADAGPETVLVVRRDDRIGLHPLPPGAVHLFNALNSADGAVALAEAARRALAADPALDLATALGLLVAHGALTAVAMPQDR